MFSQLCRTAMIVLIASTPAIAVAQSLTVYDDALQNSFQNYSWGGGSNFDSTALPRTGTKSIAFTGNNFNAISFARPAQPLTTAQYPTLKLWVHGGASGGQQLRIYLQLNDAIVAQGELDSYISGGALVANDWREVTVTFSQAPLAYSGSFDRVDIQSDITGTQPLLYIDDVALAPQSTPAVNQMLIEQNVTVGSMTSDRFTWRDMATQPRVAVLAHNDGQIGPTIGYLNRGGALREFRYQMPDNSTRIASVTNYGNGGYGGFGYVVSHRLEGSSGGIGDDSPLGYGTPGAFSRIFEGRHHAIFRFTQLYPRHSMTTANPPNQRYDVPVTIEWVFSTGRDHPLWAVTWDLSAVPADALYDDSRAPYGELNIDGVGAADIEGVAWGDRYKFTSTTTPLTLNSHWTWNVSNTVPWVKLWIASTNATMGVVQTQTMTQQDAGGGRNLFYHNLTPYWGTTSADGNAGGSYRMPWQDSWPYQANSFSLGTDTSNNNARLTWGTQYGFLGQQSYTVNDGVVANASGWPRKSYSTWIVLGPHSTDPVGAQLTQSETMQSVTLSATIGSVNTSGPAGVNRIDTASYSPAGYNHVYGALALTANANQLDTNIAVGSGTLKNPLIIVSNYTLGTFPLTVKLGGVAATADADYFASLRPGANELWITLNRNLTGAVNRIEILQAPPPELRGDANSDGAVTVRDINFLMKHLLSAEAAPASLCRGDANNDGVINGADLFFLINFLYAAGDAPSGC